MTQVIALSMCTMHARKRRLTWFQHLNLQTLRAGKLDLPRWLRIAVRPCHTSEISLGTISNPSGQLRTQEVDALCICTMHACKCCITWFQHLNLQTLRPGFASGHGPATYMRYLWILSHIQADCSGTEEVNSLCICICTMHACKRRLSWASISTCRPCAPASLTSSACCALRYGPSAHPISQLTAQDLGGRCAQPMHHACLHMRHAWYQDF